MILEIPTTLQDLSMMDNSMAGMIMATINNMHIELYATLAQAELEKKEKQQREVIQAKKDRGEWDDYGRPRVMDLIKFEKEYQRVLAGKIRPFTLMRELGISRSDFLLV